MQANLGPVAVATPQWSPDCPALQPVPKGSWRYPCGVATPVTLTLPFSLACCSLYICTQLQLPGGRKERAVWGRPEPNPASLAVALPKQAPCSLP